MNETAPQLAESTKAANKLARIVLPRYLAGLAREVFCIVKLPDSFPAIRRGGDLDLFCYDLDRVSQRLLALAKADVEALGFTVRIRRGGPDHWHLDLMDGEAIECRFDLYGAMPAYRRIRVKPGLFESIVEHAEPHEGEWQGGRFVYHLPAPLDDALIRTLEYCEYYWTGPDKLHHLAHIEALLAGGEPSRIGLLDKLHRYTAFPDYDSELVAVRHVVKLRRTPVHLWPAKVLKELKALPVRLWRRRPIA